MEQPQWTNLRIAADLMKRRAGVDARRPPAVSITDAEIICRQIRNDLEEYINQQNDYYVEADRLRAENADLRKDLARVEAICITQSDNLQRYAAGELEHNRRYTDLRAKLDAANAELHELRIKTCN